VEAFLLARRLDLGNVTGQNFFAGLAPFIMKTLVTVVASALLSWSASATAFAAPPANVNFSLERGQVFGLALDGRALTRPLARQVHVERLLPGRHWADFSVPSPYGPPLRVHTAVWLQPGLETSYVLVLRPGYGPQLRQVAAVPLYGPAPGYGGAYPQPVPQPQPGYPYGNGQGGYYGGSPNGSYNAPSPAPTPYGGNQGQGNYGNRPVPAPYGGNQGQGGYDNRQAPAPTYPGGYGNSPVPTPTPRYPGGYQQGNAQPNGANLQPLPPNDVQDLTKDLRNRPSDEERLDLAKQALADNSVRADELAQLIATLEYDKARIDLAEYGYGHVSDPQNFAKVYDVLHYPDSIQEVQQALGLPQN
jgi:hypothetical protein